MPHKQRPWLEISGAGWPLKAVDRSRGRLRRYGDVIKLRYAAEQPLTRALAQSRGHLDLVASFTPDMREADDD